MRRSISISVGVVLALAAIAAFPTSAGAAPPEPINVTFITDGTRGYLSWTQPAGEAVVRHDVALRDVTGNPQGSGTVVGKAARCYGCTSYAFTGLQNGRSYRAVVVAIGQSGPSAEVYAPTTGLLADQSACTNSGSEACVVVDATNPVAPITHGAAGLLSAPDAPDQYTDLFAPTWWRYGWNPNDPAFSRIVPDRAAEYGAKTINNLSFGWFEVTKGANNNMAAAPWWGGYGAWDNYVRDQVIDLTNRGLLPDYWEVWNEPGGNVPPIAANEAPNFTPERQLELYEHTYNTIKSIDPAAKVAAYATVGFLGHADAATSSTVALETMLAFLSSHNLGLDLLTWHELVRWNHYDTNKYADLNIDRHVEKAREMLTNAGFASTEINIDEYLEETVHHLPSWILGQIAAIERTGVLGGVRTCWTLPNPVPVVWRPTMPGCYGAKMMDNLLTGEEPGLLGVGAHPSQPRPAFWVYDAYRQMTGQRVASTASFDRMTHLAAVDGNRIAVMIGRRETCNRGSNPVCPVSEPAPPGPANQTVIVQVPTAGVYHITATLFGGGYNGAQLAPAPMTTVPTQVSSSNGTLTIPVPSLAEGEAVHLVITPA